MTRRIFRAMMIAAGAVLAASLLLIFGWLYDYFGAVQEGQLRDQAEMAAAGVEDAGAEYLQRLTSARCRLTWVAADGVVLYDTQTDAAAMENHGQREEIREALATGSGHSSRYSATLLEKTVYAAQRLADGTVLRVSVSRATVGGLAFAMLQPIIIVLTVALILSTVLANRLARRIVTPLNELDLEQPLENEAYEEIAPLLTRLDRQQQELARQLLRLRRQRDEFAQITGSMKEGLVLLDSQQKIVSINAMACRLFATEASCLGQDFLTIERSSEVSRAIDTALAEGHSEIRLDRLARCYQLDVSRIESAGAVIGGVLLAFDVSEQELAEQNRREFTANVSHELKTPLQAIIGSAELIENGLVQPEDMPRFVGHIRQEAARLVALIEDIIRLSQLDEGGQLPREDVDLLELAEEAAVSLNDAAEAKGLRLSVSGVSLITYGVRRLLYEIVYNLCDNAIKYNVDNGTVQMTVTAEGQNAVLTVRDSGIGIPVAQQSRVFERFYRVDKSHSRQSGGTGLGLSIVKHAVQYHHGTIELTSQPGVGTTIRVLLPDKRK